MPDGVFLRKVMLLESTFSAVKRKFGFVRAAKVKNMFNGKIEIIHHFSQAWSE